MKLGNLLKYYRSKNNIKQKELAKILNLSPSQLSKLESNIHTPYGDTQLNILKLLMPELNTSLLLLAAEAECNV